MLGFAIRMERRLKGLSADELAEKAGVSQATISNVERCAKAAKWSTIAKIATGLGMQRQKLDCLEWLTEGGPGSWDLREPWLRWLEELVESSGITQGQNTVKASKLRNLSDENILIFHGDPDDRRRMSEAHLAFDQEPGQRFLVSELPSILTQPPDVLKNFIRRRQVKLGGKVLDVTTLPDRVKQFDSRLEAFGERSIHWQLAIQEYLGNGGSLYGRNFFAASVDDRIAHIEHWANLLDRHDANYRVAIDPSCTPSLEFAVKPLYGVDLTGAGRDAFYSRIRGERGPRYLFWYGSFPSMAFYLEFEKYWDDIPAVWRDNKKVLAWLRGEILAAKRRQAKA